MKCHRNFKFDSGTIYHRLAAAKDNGNSGWTICVRTEEEKQRILESCHTGVLGGESSCMPIDQLGTNGTCK